MGFSWTVSIAKNLAQKIRVSSRRTQSYREMLYSHHDTYTHTRESESAHKKEHGESRPRGPHEFALEFVGRQVCPP